MRRGTAGSANKAHRSLPDIVKQIKVACEQRRRTFSVSPIQSSCDWPGPLSGAVTSACATLGRDCRANRLRLPSYHCKEFILVSSIRQEQRSTALFLRHGDHANSNGPSPWSTE